MEEIKKQLTELIQNVEQKDIWGKLTKEQHNLIISDCLKGMRSLISLRHGATFDNKGCWNDITIIYKWLGSGGGESGSAGAASASLKPNEGFIELYCSFNESFKETIYCLHASDVLQPVITPYRSCKPIREIVSPENKTWDKFFSAPQFLWASLLQLMCLP